MTDTSLDWAGMEAARVNYYNEDYYLEDQIAAALRAAFLRGRIEGLREAAEISVYNGCVCASEIRAAADKLESEK